MSWTFRKTTQGLAPGARPADNGHFNIYPALPVGSGQIQLGFPALARRLAAEERIILDGMGGVLWEDFRARLAAALASLGLEFQWLDVSQALRPHAALGRFLSPFLGGDDPLFGARNTRPLSGFFCPKNWPLWPAAPPPARARSSTAQARPWPRPRACSFIWTCPKTKSNSAPAPARWPIWAPFAGRPQSRLQTVLLRRLAAAARPSSRLAPPPRPGRGHPAPRRAGADERRRLARRPGPRRPLRVPRPPLVRARALGRAMDETPFRGPLAPGPQSGLVLRTDFAGKRTGLCQRRMPAGSGF